MFVNRYVLLFNLSDALSRTLAEVSFWVSSLLARVKQPQVFLVGTHADRIKGEKKCMERLDVVVNHVLERFGRPIFTAAYYISCAEQKGCGKYRVQRNYWILWL